jgi:hypothetical protein
MTASLAAQMVGEMERGGLLCSTFCPQRRVHAQRKTSEIGLGRWRSQALSLLLASLLGGSAGPSGEGEHRERGHAAMAAKMQRRAACCSLEDGLVESGGRASTSFGSAKDWAVGAARRAEPGAPRAEILARARRAAAAQRAAAGSSRARRGSAQDAGHGEELVAKRTRAAPRELE